MPVLLVDNRGGFSYVELGNVKTSHESCRILIQGIHQDGTGINYQRRF